MWHNLLIPIWILGIASFGISLLDIFERMSHNPEPYRAVFIGMGIMTVIYFLLKKSIYFRWVQTLSHELTHALFGILARNKITKFNVSLRGNENGSLGFVEQEGSSHFIITLTPYCFPIFTYFLLIFRPFLEGDLLFTYDIILGATYAYHLWTFFQQMGTHQTDFTRSGILFSYTFVFFVNFLLLGFFFSYIGGGLDGITHFFQSGLHYAQSILYDLANYISRFIT